MISTHACTRAKAQASGWPFGRQGCRLPTSASLARGEGVPHRPVCTVLAVRAVLRHQEASAGLPTGEQAGTQEKACTIEEPLAVAADVPTASRGGDVAWGQKVERPGWGDRRELEAAGRRQQRVARRRRRSVPGVASCRAGQAVRGRGLRMGRAGRRGRGAARRAAHGVRAHVLHDDAVLPGAGRGRAAGGAKARGRRRGEAAGLERRPVGKAQQRPPPGGRGRRLQPQLRQLRQRQRPELLEVLQARQGERGRVACGRGRPGGAPAPGAVLLLRGPGTRRGGQAGDA
jgi:hypothetical protein